MAKVRMLVSVRDSHLDVFDTVVAAVEQAGMQVDAPMRNIGVVSGLIEADKVDILRGIDGVADVQPDRTFRTAPETS